MDKRFRRGLSYIVLILIFSVIIISILASYLLQTTSLSQRSFVSIQNYRNFIELSREEKLVVDLESNVIGSDIINIYLLRNIGKIPVDIIRWWILNDNNMPMIILKSYVVQPGGSLDLNQTASALGAGDVSKILFVVTARGNIIPISSEAERLYGELIPRIPPPQSQPTNPVIYKPTALSIENFTELISDGKVSAYYKRPTDERCNLDATPLVVNKFDNVMAPYPALVAAYRDQGGYTYEFLLANKQSACARFIIKNLVAYNISIKNFYVKSYIGFYARAYYVRSVDVFYITVVMRLIDSSNGLEVGSASQTIYYRFDPMFYMAYDSIPVILKLDAKYVDPNYLNNRYFDVEISIYVYLYAQGGDSFYVKLGVHEITFFGAEVRLG
jgi:hypothetical protein